MDIIKNIQSYCVEFRNLFGLKDNISSQVLLSIAKDSTYAHNLHACRNVQSFLEHLIKNPALDYTDEEVEKEFLDSTLFSKLDNIIKESKISFVYEDNKKNYEDKYGSYIEEEKKKNPEAKPCKPCAEIKVNDFREVYLDSNGTTYIRDEIVKLLKDYYDGVYGYANPSSSTVQGHYTFDIMNSSRKTIADCLMVDTEEIYFTGSGSESNNLAIKGIAFKHLDKKGHIITTKIEHPSVLRTMEYLETLGFLVTYIDVDKLGRISPEDIKNSIKENTILVSVMAANNEIGTINPIKEIGDICREYNIPFMVDAIQAFGKIPLKPKEWGISLLTFSGHKIYAPKGIGGIYVENGLSLVPIIHGGGQEYGLRAGTENVGHIMALGMATKLAYNEMNDESNRFLELRKFFLEEIEKIEPDYIVNGLLENRLPNNLNIGFPLLDSSAIIRSLNNIGISVSPGSACSSKRIKTSHVLEAIGTDTKNYASIRFSFGLNTSKEDLEYLFKYLKKIIYILKSNNEEVRSEILVEN